MHQSSTALHIESTPPAERHKVLRLLQLGTARIERLIEAAEAGEIDMEGLLHARRGDTIVGAAWGQRMPGHLAFCWSPHIAAGEPEETAQLLQAAVDQYLDAAGVVISQAILPPRDVLHAVRLTRAGYRHLADLDYLVSTSDQFPVREPTSELSFLSHSRRDDSRLQRLISQIYINALDCAELDRVRKLDDVLAGYRRTGVFRPNWWLIARHEGEDVGCLILGDFPEHEQCELIYMGIIPAARGRGWGTDLTRQAQWLAQCAGRERIVLAVDEANWPAVNLYRCAGFEPWDQRSVYVRTACPNGSSPPSSDAPD